MNTGNNRKNEWMNIQKKIQNDLVCEKLKKTRAIPEPGHTIFFPSWKKKKRSNVVYLYYISHDHHQAYSVKKSDIPNEMKQIYWINSFNSLLRCVLFVWIENCPKREAKIVFGERTFQQGPIDAWKCNVSKKETFILNWVWQRTLFVFFLFISRFVCVCVIKQQAIVKIAFKSIRI